MKAFFIILALVASYRVPLTIVVWADSAGVLVETSFTACASAIVMAQLAKMFDPSRPKGL